MENVGLHGGVLGYVVGVLSYMVESVGLHSLWRVLGYMVVC